ncbi:MAG: HEAT repeat domain-containing protein, partial [Planctomycetota bacterium]|nr:HEAT repeat domain-containing protein [Planctomycetota bacterium]
AFDQFGNLFTVDNNANIGDLSRVHYIIEGGNAGWHTGHQVLTTFSRHVGLKNDTFTPWTADGIWKTKFEGQPADIIPPVAYLTSGPVGLMYNPGIGLPERYSNHFFVCDYKASAPRSGVHAFAFERDGAGYKMVGAHEFIWGINNTDVEFGYDGRLYISDYIGGWGIPNKGRIHVAWHTESAKEERIAEVKKIFTEGFKRPQSELAEMLGHPDMRVRLRAQFALAKAGGIEHFISASNGGENLLLRLHGVWGIGQCLRLAADNKLKAGRETIENALQALAALLGDREYEIRRHAGRSLGNAGQEILKASGFVLNLIPLLRDNDLSVRVEAGIALGKLKSRDAVQPLLKLLAENADKDVYVRHAGVMGIVGCMAPPDLVALGVNENASVRLGAVLALRRLKHPGIARFLKDRNAAVVREAIRAINDENIAEA